MFIHLLIAVLAYAGLLIVIDRVAIPDPGPIVAKIVVSVVFVAYVLNEFGLLSALP